MSSPFLRPKSPPHSCSKLFRISAYGSNHSLRLPSAYKQLTSDMNLKQSTLPVFLRARRGNCETHFEQFNDLRMLDHSMHHPYKPDSVYVNHRELTARELQSLRETGPLSSRLIDVCTSLIKQKKNNNNERVFIASTSYATNIFINKRLISHCKVSVLQYDVLLFPVIADHWLLLVVKLSERNIFVIDPHGSENPHGLVQSLLQFLRNEVFFDKAAHAQWKEYSYQKLDGKAHRNLSGLYVLKTIDNIWTGIDESVDDLSPFRSELLNMINA